MARHAPVGRAAALRLRGYARLATLGEEVRDPARTISRAIVLALGISLFGYVGVAVAILAVLGPDLQE